LLYRIVWWHQTETLQLLFCVYLAYIRSCGRCERQHKREFACRMSRSWQCVAALLLLSSACECPCHHLPLSCLLAAAGGCWAHACLSDCPVLHRAHIQLPPAAHLQAAFTRPVAMADETYMLLAHGSHLSTAAPLTGHRHGSRMPRLPARQLVALLHFSHHPAAHCPLVS
jgi:hypothetical protein